MTGVIMAIPFKKLEGFALILVISISAYLMIVQLVNGYGYKGLLKSFQVKSSEKHTPNNRFAINDFFVIEAECEHVTAYRLEFYQNSSLVFEQHGNVPELAFSIRTLVVPPTFKAGSGYVAVFYADVLNEPLPGAFFSDSKSYVFDVEGTETRLKLSGGYDGFFGSLCLRGNLTDVDGFPVANENIEFGLQFSRKHKATDGWFPLGSAVTNESGIAKFCTALSVPCGNYTTRAKHVENANYGESETTFDVEVSNSSRFEGLGFFTRSEGAVGEEVSGLGVVSMTMNYDANPYTVLPTCVNVTVTFNCSISQYLRVVIFKLGSLSNGFPLNASSLEPVGPPSQHNYTASLTWTPDERIPDVVGLHSLVAGVYVGDLQGYIIAVRNGTGIIASEEATIEVHLCPSDTVVHFPQVVYHDYLPMTVAVAKPRLYGEVETGGFAAFSLAPKFAYNGLNYVIDEPVKWIPVLLYANDTRKASGFTNEGGWVPLSPYLNYGAEHFNLKLEIEVNGTSLYQGKNVTQEVTFTRININSTGSGESSIFRLSYTLGVGDQEEKPICVKAETPVEVTAGLSGLPVLYAPVSVLVGKPLNRSCIDSLGWVSITGGSCLLRVTNLFDVNATEAQPSCDLNHDGVVDLKDVFVVAKAFGTYPADPKWNWSADIDFSLKVDLKDYFAVSRSYGKKVSYISMADIGNRLKAVFYRQGEQLAEKYSDQWGCFSDIPSSADKFRLYLDGKLVGGVVEFFRSAFHEGDYTDSLGRTKFNWAPEETGNIAYNYQPGTLKPYFMSVLTLPSSNVLAARWINSTSVKAMLNLVRFLNVTKRPIGLSVEYMPKEPTVNDNVTMITDAFCTETGLPEENLKVGFYLYYWVNASEILMGCAFTNSTGMATLEWSPREYMEKLPYFNPHTYVIVKVNETAVSLGKCVQTMVDARYKTMLELLSSNVTNVNAGQLYPRLIVVKLVDSNESLISGRTISLYCNDSLCGDAITDINGTAFWDGSFTNEGVRFYRAVFRAEGVETYYSASNEVKIVVVVKGSIPVIPVSVQFDVQPREFEVGTKLTLSARVVDPDSGNPLADAYVEFYRVLADGSETHIDTNLTGSDGWTTINHIYSLGWGTYTFAVKVSSFRVVGGANAKVIAVSPTMMKVASFSKLHLGFGKIANDEYRVWGMLLSYYFGVRDKPIKIYVNDTLVGEDETYGIFGKFNVTLNMPMMNNSATLYNLKAIFEGDEAQNVTSNLRTPNGTKYAVCTTIHYGYEPAVNSAAVTIEPQAPQIVAAANMTETEDGVEIDPPKTPEQMQKEAEQNGLTIWHEFSWWYPWYRMHVRITINPIMDVGFNPVLPDEGIYTSSEDWWDFLFGTIQEFSYDFGMGMLKIGLARIVTYLLERPLPEWVAAVVAVTGFAGALILLSMDWNNKWSLLGGALAALIVMVATAAWKIAPLIQGLASYILRNPWLHALSAVFTEFTRSVTSLISGVFRKIVDIAEIIFGVILLFTAVTRAFQL